MKRNFHLRKNCIGAVFIAAILVFSYSLLSTGCLPSIPSEITIKAPPGSSSNWGGNQPTVAPGAGTNNPSSKINLAETQNFYVAVMDINLSGNISKEMKLPLTNAIIGEFVSLNKFRVVDRMNRDAILEEQGFQQTGCVDNTCSVEVGRLLGVNRMVVGSVSLVGNKYNINIQVLNVETGQIESIAEKSVSCNEEDLLGWVKLTARELFK